MRVFICGGGSGNDTTEATKRLNDIINHTKPILYIPLAMDEVKHSYDGCFQWVTSELAHVEVPYIDMVLSFDELETKNYQDYAALFIGGGNTFKLLKGLKETKCFEKIQEYLQNNGIVFGGSAGAIILGNYIDTCKYADKNEVNLEDLRGFNVINNYSLLCHFTNQDQNKTELNRKYLLELSKEEQIIALPEEVTLYIEDGKYKIFGNKPFYIFEKGNIITYNSSFDRVNKYNEIKSANELLEFMNTNISYGFVDDKNNLHFNNLINFRKDYRTGSIEEILQSGLGTCIEQVKLERDVFNKLGVENKLYCYRAYENEDNFDQEVRMHCFVLFQFQNNWYHFEHSNSKNRGIHAYGSIEQALDTITSRYEEQGDIRTLTEIDCIPDHLTFKEFNEYVNQFDNKKRTK